jgi:hypothetical protein
LLTTLGNDRLSNWQPWGGGFKRGKVWVSFHSPDIKDWLKVVSCLL